MSSLREDIISHLKAKGNYSPEVDDSEIDRLIDNMKLYNYCLKELSSSGVSEQYEYKPGHTVTRINPLVDALQKFQANINKSTSKLGISRNDRIKLKLLEEKQGDDFDRDFSA